MLEIYDEEGNAFVEPGTFKLFLGGSLPTQRSLELGASNWVEAEFEVR